LLHYNITEKLNYIKKPVQFGHVIRFLYVDDSSDCYVTNFVTMKSTNN